MHPHLPSTPRAGERHLDVVATAAASQREHEAGRSTRRLQPLAQLVEGVDPLAVEAEKTIASLDADALRHAAPAHAGHDEPVVGLAGLETEEIPGEGVRIDRKSTRLNSSHLGISYAVFCLK